MSETVVPSIERDYDESKLVYWNDFEQIRAHLNTLVSGDPATGWMEWLAGNHPPFERALSLSCGHGWVERSLFERGVIKSVVGVDVSREALASARQDADDLGMPAEYVEIDVNIGELPRGPFDLVVNHAGLHHAAYIDRVVRGAWGVIAESGLFAHYDYTGAHRNQYGAEAWAAALEFNASLPERFRNPSLDYPHLPTMLVVDPTEAVHSELILETLDRYFETEVLVPLGGAIAYPILYENRALDEAADTPAGRAVIQRIIDRDLEFLGDDPLRSTFTFAVMRPRPGVLDDVDRLAAWTAAERERERRAAENGGEYYPRTAFSIVSCDLADARDRVAALVVSDVRVIDPAATVPSAHGSPVDDARRLARRMRSMAGRIYRGVGRRGRAVVGRLRPAE